MEKVTISQLDELYQIEVSCFQHPYTLEQLRYEIIENEFSYVYAIYEQGRMIGFIDYWITFEVCQLNQIAVLSEYRKQGIATHLMNEMIHHAEEALCESIMLEVRASNTKAQGMYEKLGFMNLNIRKGYYTDNGEDAIVMVKPLGGNY